MRCTLFLTLYILATLRFGVGLRLYLPHFKTRWFFILYQYVKSYNWQAAYLSMAIQSFWNLFIYVFFHISYLCTFWIQRIIFLWFKPQLKGNQLLQHQYPSDKVSRELASFRQDVLAHSTRNEGLHTDWHFYILLPQFDVSPEDMLIWRQIS